MTTKNSSYSRIVAVWLVLLAFLCGMIVPSLALAKQEMEIAMEGDPTDGLDFAGGGGGGDGTFDGGGGEVPPSIPGILDQKFSWGFIEQFNFIFLTSWENGQLKLVFIFDGLTEFQAGAKK